jgi:hypothetical protein
MMTDKNPMDPLYVVHALAGETLGGVDTYLIHKTIAARVMTAR